MSAIRLVLAFASIDVAAASTEAFESLMFFDSLPSSEPPIVKVFVICASFYGVVGTLWFLFSRLSKDTANYETLRIGLNCTTYSACAITMHVLNKSLAVTLKEPGLISIAQMIVAVGFFATVAGKEFMNSDRKSLGIWCIVPVFFAAMLITGFYMYEYISLSMLTIMRNLTPLVVLPVETMFMPPETRPQTNTAIVISMVCMLIGAFLYGGSLEVSMLGIAFSIVNMLIAVTDRLIQRRLLTDHCKGLSSSTCTILNNGIGIFPTLLLATFTHEVSEAGSPEMAAHWMDPIVLCILFISGFVGMGVGYYGMEAQRDVSATSFFVLQNTSKIGVVILGVAVFSDPIKSMVANLGLLMSLGGSFAYGHAQMQLKADADKEKQKLIQEAKDEKA